MQIARNEKPQCGNTGADIYKSAKNGDISMNATQQLKVGQDAAIVSFSEQGVAVTTSLAIAVGVGNPHSSVIRLIRKNVEDLQEFGLVGFEIRPRSKGQHGGGDIEYATLNEQQATLLMTYMRNNDVVRAFKKRLVKEFYQLATLQREQGSSMPSWYSRLSPETRMAIEDMDRQLAEKERQLQLVQPKVEFAEQVSISPDAISVGEAAKLCGTGRTRLFAFLRQMKWLTRHNEPYQAMIENGYMDVKISQFDHPTQGLKNSITPLITGKGLLRLQAKLKEGQANGTTTRPH